MITFRRILIFYIFDVYNLDVKVIIKITLEYFRENTEVKYCNIMSTIKNKL